VALSGVGQAGFRGDGLIGSLLVAGDGLRLVLLGEGGGFSNEPYRTLIDCGTVITHASVVSLSIRGAGGFLRRRRRLAVAVASESLLPAATTALPLLVCVVEQSLFALPVPELGGADAVGPASLAAVVAAVWVTAVARPANGELLPAATAQLR